jgi:RTX calcium-binding nonapeptide repeat (4 copies)
VHFQVFETDVLRGISNVVGSSHDETITGNEKDNIIDGGLGNDTLIGGGGNDTVAIKATMMFLLWGMNLRSSFLALAAVMTSISGEGLPRVVRKS